MDLSRRAMLRALGLSAGSAFALPLLGSLSRAHAQSASFPTRLVVVTRGQGTLPEHLVIPGVSETDFSLGSILSPLAAYQSRMTVCTGVNDDSNALDGSYNGHTRCLLHTWTARGMEWQVGADGVARPVGAGGASFDQVVASRWAGLTPYDSLEFGVGASTQTTQAYSWKGVGQPLLVENSPSAMYERLFEDLVGTDPAELAARLARRQSVLDAVKKQFDVVLPQVSSADNVKLQTHLASIESLEQAIAGGSLGDACIAPSLDLSDTSTPAKSAQMIEMLAMALACDLTRVCSLSFGDYQDWPWLDVDFPSGWHDAVHAGPATVDLEADLISSYAWYSEQLAALLAALDAIPEGDGTVLDHTLVVVGNVFARGSDHSSDGKTYLLFGGGAGHAGGRHLDLGGAAHGDLFAALLQGLGFDDDSFGDPTFANGALTGVLA